VAHYMRNQQDDDPDLGTRDAHLSSAKSSIRRRSTNGRVGCMTAMRPFPPRIWYPVSKIMTFKTRTSQPCITNSHRHPWTSEANAWASCRAVAMGVLSEHRAQPGTICTCIVELFFFFSCMRQRGMTHTLDGSSRNACIGQSVPAFEKSMV
jgi:hypothetical protein